MSALRYPLLPEETAARRSEYTSEEGATEQGRTRTESVTSGRTGAEAAGRQRYERSRAFFCVYPDGCFRGACIDIVCNVWFNRAILVCICINALTISLDDPLHDNLPYSLRYTIEVIDNIFLGIFTLEFIVKLVAMGGFVHRSGYFRELWNWLDFAIVFSGIFGLIMPHAANLSILRVVRIFRPLRTISRVKGMRDLVDTLGTSLPILLNVMMLCFFLFFIFGLVGVISWSSALHNRCYGWSDEEDDFTYTTVCGNDSVFEFFRVNCAENRTCVSGAPNPNPWANWDHVGSSFLVVTQCLTLDDWVTHMYHVQDGWSPFAAVYFVVVTLVGAFFLLNLVLAVITDSFTRFAIEEDDKDLQAARDNMQQRVIKQRTEQEASEEGGEANYSELPSETTSSCSSRPDSPGSLHENKNVAARSRTRQNSLYLNSSLPGLEQGAQRLLRDQSTKREWKKFTEGLDKAGRKAIKNFRKLEGSREWTSHVRGITGRRRAGTCIQPSIDKLQGMEDGPRRRSEGTVISKKIRNKIVQAQTIESSLTLRSLDAQSRKKLMQFTDSAYAVQLTDVNEVSSEGTAVTLTNMNSNFGRSENSNENNNHGNGDRGTNINASEENMNPLMFPKSMRTALVEPESLAEGEAIDSAWKLHLKPDRASVMRNFGRDIVTHPYFINVMTGLIVLNALVMSVEHYHMEPWINDVLELSNIIIVSIFTFETVIKLLSLSLPEFYEDDFNVIDAVIVVMSLAELIFLSSSAATVFRILRLARVVRVVKLARGWRVLKHIVKTVGSSLSYMGYLLLLLMLFIFVFGILGRQMFAGKVSRCCVQDDKASGLYNCYKDTDEHYIYDACWNTAWKRTHFDTLFWSMIAVFQIVTQDNWTAVMYKTMSDVGGFSAVYFLIILIFGRYMLLNLFVAILLVGLEKEHAKRDELSSADGDACDDFNGVLDDSSEEEECEYPPQVRYEEKQAQREYTKSTKTAMRSTHEDSPTGPLPNGSFKKLAAALASPRRRGNSLIEPSNVPITPRVPPTPRVVPKLKLSSLIAPPSPVTRIPLQATALKRNEEVLKKSKRKSREDDPFHGWEQIMRSPTESNISGGLSGPAISSPQAPNSSRMMFTSINATKVPAAVTPLALKPRGWSFADMPRYENDPMTPMTARTRRKFSRLRSQSLFKQLNGADGESYISDEEEILDVISLAPLPSARQKRLSLDSAFHSEYKWRDEPLTARSTKSPETKFMHILPQPTQSRVANYRHAPKKRKYPHTEIIRGKEIAFRRDIYGLYDWQAVIVKPNGQEVEVLLGYSWGCISPTNKIRRFLWKVVDGTFFPFEKVIGYLIFASCAALMMNDKTVGHSHTAVVAIETLDLMFTIIFLVEIVMRITVYTFRSPEAGKSAYVRRARWNWLDLLIVGISVVMLPLQYIVQRDVVSGMAATVYKVARALRAWRPLRILVRSQNMQIVIGALVGTIPAVFNVFAVASVSYFMFGVASVQLFKGAFMACNDGSNRTYEECNTSTYFVASPVEPFASWVNDSYAMNSSYPDGVRLFRRRWENIYAFNFNNIGHSLLTLLQCAILNGWTEVLYAVVDSGNTEDGPTRRSDNEAMGLLVVLWVFFGGLGIMNVFVGCVVDYFSRLKTRLDRSALLTKNQMQALRIKKILANQKAKHRLVPDENASIVSKACYSIVSHKLFAALVVLAICINVLIMTTIHYEQANDWTRLQAVSNIFFSALFTLEMLLKIGVAGIRVYVATNWNRLDGLIVISSWLEVIITEFVTHGNAGSVVQLFRLGRILRLIRHFKGLKKLFLTMYYSVPALLNVGSLLLLVFFISGVTAMVFFEGIRKVDFNDNYLNGHYNFETFPMSILTLYRVSTFDNWRQVLRACLIHPPQCTGSECGATSGLQALLISLFFSVFVLTVGFVMFNLFIAVVLENFRESVLLPPQLLAKMELVKMFREKWASYDPTAVQIIKAYNFVPLMMQLPSPIGFMDCEPHEILPSLLHLDFPVTRDSDILFMDVIDAIGETIFKIKLVDREAAKQHMSSGKRDVSKDKERYALGFTIGDWYAACVIQTAWRKWRGPLWKKSRFPNNLTGFMISDMHEKSYRRFPFGRPQVKPKTKKNRWVLAFSKKQGEEEGGKTVVGKERSDTLISIFSKGVKDEVAKIRRRNSEKSFARLRTVSSLTPTETQQSRSPSLCSSSSSSVDITPGPRPIVPANVPPLGFKRGSDTQSASMVSMNQVTTPTQSMTSHDASHSMMSVTPGEGNNGKTSGSTPPSLMSTFYLARPVVSPNDTVPSSPSKVSTTTQTPNMKNLDTKARKDLLEQMQGLLKMPSREEDEVVSPGSLMSTLNLERVVKSPMEIPTISSFTFSPETGRERLRVEDDMDLMSPFSDQTMGMTFNLSETGGSVLRRGFGSRHTSIVPPPPIQIPKTCVPAVAVEVKPAVPAPQADIKKYVPWPKPASTPSVASPLGGVEAPSPTRRRSDATLLGSPSFSSSIASPATLHSPLLKVPQLRSIPAALSPSPLPSVPSHEPKSPSSLHTLHSFRNTMSLHNILGSVSSPLSNQASLRHASSARVIKRDLL